MSAAATALSATPYEKLRAEHEQILAHLDALHSVRKDLEALGVFLAIEVVDATHPAPHHNGSHATTPKSQRTVRHGQLTPGKPCARCGFATEPPHDGRMHFRVGIPNKFRTSDLTALGYTKLT
jgi:hypothetical protein